MKLFSQAEALIYNGWRHVTLIGFQVGPKFLNERGTYQYGVFSLAGDSLAKIEAELIQKDSSSIVNFAIIDTVRPDWSPARTNAFRHDLDFYVFTGISPAKASALQDYVEASGPTVLCMATALLE